ncbi:oligosaccharide flippase family protein [Vibrio sp. YYF0003]|uniref:oligosaccharide flippase family protein n=1 Tax=Vibrio sp. YYF0003 TaxID=3116646 RepID=UPI002EB7CDA4|nr:oligosaccharide flippase family protein [Vibrio sp. YYF0003]
MKNKLYNAIYQSVMGKLGLYIIQFLVLAIYARLFSPEDFGVIATYYIFMMFFQLIGDVGIGPAIINHKNFCSQRRDGVFSITLLLGICTATIFFYFSFFIGYYYDFEPSKTNESVIIVISLSLFFNTCTTIPITAFNKDAKFVLLSMLIIIAEVISFLVVFLLYKYKFGVVALASRYLAFSVCKFCLLWLFSNKTTVGRPVLGTKISYFLEILSFSLYQLGFNAINFFSRNIDNLLIAKFFGMHALGIYDKSYQLMRYPLLLTTFAMTPAIQPILTKYRDNKSYIIKEHNSLAKKLFYISTLCSVFLFVNSKSIVFTLFGSDWLEVSQYIKVFSFIIPVQAVLSTSGAFFQVVNKPKLLFLSGVLSAIINVSFIVLGVMLGDAIYVAKMLVISFTINFFITYVLLFKYGFLESSFDFYKGLGEVVVNILPIILMYCVLSYFLNIIISGEIVLLFSNLFISLLSLICFKRSVVKCLI